MGLFGDNKGSIIHEIFMPIETLPGFKGGAVCDIALYEDKLVITEGITKNSATLTYEQITDVVREPQSTIIEKNKSVLGRGAIGLALAGPLGAVIGGMSGTGTKKKKMTKMYLIIGYISAMGENKVLCFEDNRMYKGGKLTKKLKELANVQEESAKSKDPNMTVL